jgi:hypothetical protein
MANTYPGRKVRKPIQDMIAELRSWLPNYDHGEKEYPTLVWRLLASMPGGDEAEDMGYEPFNISWQEIAQLGDMLNAVQDKGDVEDLVAGLMSEEDPEDLEEARRHPSYGNKRDFPKIDIYVDGNYVATTTWARTAKEAVEQYIAKNRNAASRKVTAKRQETPPARRRTR